MSEEVKHQYWSRPQVTKMLSVPYTTLATWEKFFNVVAHRSEKGSRKFAYFTMEQVALFHHIRRLMVDEKYTVEGAKIQLRKANLI